MTSLFIHVETVIVINHIVLNLQISQKVKNNMTKHNMHCLQNRFMDCDFKTNLTS